MHASQSFPSAVLIFFEAVATICLLLWISQREPAGPRARIFAVWLRRLGSRPDLCGLGAAILAGLGTAGIFWLLGPPIPKVTDEHAYLFAADTIAHGRLVNPTHPHWRSFDIYSVHQPVHLSKYPPAQGLLLAIGEVIDDDPTLGLCLGAGLLVGASARAFFAWLRPTWAVLATLLVLLRLGLGGYWNQSFWGGSLAAAGGALIFAGARNLVDVGAERRFGPAVELALGLILLAFSRPFEGLLLAIPVGCWLLFRLVVAPRSLAPSLVVLGMMLAAAGVGMAAYNLRLTGDPWLPPHLAYARAYDAPLDFIFQERSGDFTGEQKHDPGEAAPPIILRPVSSWLGQAAVSGLWNFARSTLYFLGFLPALGILGLAVSLAGALARYLWVPIAAVALVAVGNALYTVYFPHYAAPMAVPLIVLALIGWRRLGARRWSMARFFAGVVGLNAVLMVIQLPAQRPDADDWSRTRREIIDFLESSSGDDLVVVDGMTDWVANGAEIDNAPIIWARHRSYEIDRALFDYYPKRRLWWVDAHVEDPWPRPIPRSWPILEDSSGGGQVLLERPHADQ